MIILQKANKRKIKSKKQKEILITPFYFLMYKFSKKERLCSDSDIQRLFDENNFFIYDKIKLYWNLVLSEENNIEVLFSVPKKIIPNCSQK